MELTPADRAANIIIRTPLSYRRPFFFAVSTLLVLLMDYFQYFDCVMCVCVCVCVRWQGSETETAFH